MWGGGQIRDPKKMSNAVEGIVVAKRDLNWAINNCKSTIQAIKYQQDQTVADIMVKQATRIGQAFDEIENLIPQKLADGSYNRLPYSSMDLGDLWRAWIYGRYNTAIVKAREFLDMWVDEIVKQHGPEDEDGDTNMSDGESDGNSDVVKRVLKLKAAYAALPQWNNPLPASWA